MLITGTTRHLIGDSFPTPRLCRVRVVGIGAPTDLYELHGGHPTPEWLAMRDAYETALSLCERGEMGRVVCRPLPDPPGSEGGFQINPRSPCSPGPAESLRSPPDTGYDVIELSHK